MLYWPVYLWSTGQKVRYNIELRDKGLQIFLCDMYCKLFPLKFKVFNVPSVARTYSKVPQQADVL